MNKKILLFFTFFLLINFNLGTVSACISSTECDCLKSTFGATEIVSYEGSCPSPTKVIFWAMATCPGSGYFAYNVPSGYTSVNCYTDSALGTHGGCPNCLMSRIELVKNSTPTPPSNACGSANNGTFQSVPTSGLCSSGTASRVSVHEDEEARRIGFCYSEPRNLPGNSYDRWYWTCGDVKCSADNPNDSIRSLFGATELVSYTGSSSNPDRIEFWAEAYCPNSGSQFDYTVPSGYTLTSCSRASSLGSHGGCACCVMSKIVLTKKASPVNGSCGSSNNQSFISKPTSNLCNSGTASLVTGTGPWYWTCYGQNGGTDASCSAFKTQTNRDPVVNAGTDKEVNEGSSIKIYATASDPDGDCLTYSWSCTGGSLSSTKILSPTFYAPTVTSDRTYTCTLTVSDGKGGTASDSVNILVKNLEPVNACGSANNGTFQSVPTSGLCSSGTASRVSVHEDEEARRIGFCYSEPRNLPGNSYDRWYWTCGDVKCSADNPNDSIRSLFGATELVSYTGSSSNPDRIEFWAEAYCPNSGSQFDYTVPSGYTLTSCSRASSLGSHGGCACCVMSKIVLTKKASPVNGSCGSSNNQSFISKPTSNLCNSGTASLVTGTGPWYWTCYGQNGGTDASCSAFKTQTNRDPVVNAGTDKEVNEGSSIKIYATASDPDGDCLTYSWSCTGGSLSSTKILSPTFYAPTVTSDRTYTCTLTVSDGKGGTASDSVNILVKNLEPVNACGSANNGTFQSVPTSGLCSSGTASRVSVHEDEEARRIGFCYSEPRNLPGNSYDRWYWTCGDVKCSADNPNDSIRSLFGATELVSYTGSSSNPDRIEFWAEAYCPNSGSQFDYTVPSGYTLTSCSRASSLGSHGGCACCVMSKIVLTKKASPVNGSCGSSNNQSFISKPTSNLCNSGTASLVTGTGPWYWTCYGQNGGTDASCSAFKTQTNRDPVVNAGTDKEVNEGSSIKIYATASDPDGDCLTYSWSCTKGSMSDYSSLSPMYYAPNVTSNTTAVCTITVSDGKGGTASDSVNILVKNLEPVNACGSANNGTFQSVPTSGLCSSGTASRVSVHEDEEARRIGFCYSEPRNLPGNSYDRWYWTCGDVKCSADNPNDSIRSLFGATELVSYTGSSSNPDRIEFWAEAYCPNSGSQFDYTVPSGYTLTSCSRASSLGSHGGCACCVMSKIVLTKKASPVNGSCGSSNNQSFISKPTSNLCNSGTASLVTGTGPWYWTCYGQNGGTDASCSAFKTQTNRDPVVNAGTDKEVNEGSSIKIYATASDPDGDCLTYSWSCTKGSMSDYSSLSPMYYAPNVTSNTTAVCTITVSDGKGGTASDSVNILVKNIPDAINGECGSANGQSFISKPTANLCNLGTASSVTGTGPWYWTCYGENGGTNQSCSANKTQTNNPPTANAGGDKEVQSGQTVSMNATASDPDGDYLTYSWTCTKGSMSSYSVLNPVFQAPNVTSNTTATCTLTVDDGNGGHASDSVNILVRAIQNNDPYVDAGSNKNIQSGQSIYMNATASDPDGDYLTYSWSCTKGSMSSYSNLNPMYYAPSVSSYTTATCTLTVDDGKGGSSSDSVTIYINAAQNEINGQCGSANGGTFSYRPTYNLCYEGNASSVTGNGPWYWTCYGENGGSNASCMAYKTQETNNNPYVDAGSNRNVQAGQSTYFSATANDPDGDYLTYSWSCTGGSLSSYSILNPTFYAPTGSYSTTYTCTLTVNDGRGGYASDSVSIYVGGGYQTNNNPYVDAGSNRNVQAGQSTYFSATANDPDGDYLTYSWSCTGGSLSSYSILNPTFYAPTGSYSTTYTCTLTVNDGRGGYASDSVSIYVGGGYQTNNNPYVDAGSNRNVQAGQSTYFSATANDPDGDYLTYSWSCTGGSLSSYSILNPTFYAPTGSYSTTYTCTLTVNDGRGGYASDSVSIYVGGGYVYQTPLVVTNNATSITTNSARMNGYLSNDGGENTSVRFNWGRLNSFSYNTSWIDYKRTGNYFYADATYLEKGKAYQFRAEAKNSRGTVYGSTLKFITKPDSPYNFDASLISNSYVRLTWGRGEGSCNTAITRKLNSYPGTITDGTLVYYGNDTSYADYDIVLGNNYYYRAWSIACDGDMYAISDSLYSKDFVTTYKPSTPITPIIPITPVTPKCSLGIDIQGRNLTQSETAWKDSIYASPAEEVEIMITVTALDCRAQNVILTNILPLKIDDVYDVKVEGQSFCGDASGSFILGTIEKGESKTIIFKLKISGEDSFVYGVTDITNTSEANAKNIETVNDTLNIRVSKKTGEEAMAGLAGFISRNWKIFYLLLGLLLGLIIFLIILLFLRETDRKRKLKEENLLLEKSKYFHIQ